MNQTTNLGVIIDIKLDAGGALHMSQSHLFFLEKLKRKNKNFNVSLITTNKKSFSFFKKNYNFKIFLYEKNLFSIRLLNYFYKNFFKYLSLNSHLETFLKQKKINLVYFSSPSYLVLLFKNLSFIYTVFDLIDKKLENLKEHNKSTVIIRNKSYKHASLYAKKISITNNQRRKIFIKNYNCKSSKIFTIQFPPNVCLANIESKNVKINFPNKKIKSYMFYPAQYWSHKNHSYIIKSIQKFKSRKLKNIGCIFTGYDKGYLDYLRNLSIKEKVQDKIIFFNYLTNNELVYLYKNSFCVLFPSLIGFDSLPMYESFFFKKIILYNQNSIDKVFNKNIIPLDINNFHDLEKKILLLKSNKIFYDKFVLNNFQFYKQKFLQLEKSYYKLFII
jgi:glycosyltransferase involved in cell wall biosynthesis